MRLLAGLAIASLAGCSFYDDGDRSCPENIDPGACLSWDDCVTEPGAPGWGRCGGTIFECQDGAWEAVGWCDPPRLAVGGDLTLHLELTSAGCADLVPPDPVVIAETEYDVESGFDEASVAAILTQAWQTESGEPVVPTVAYSLSAERGGAITGNAVAQLGECEAQFDVTGSYAPE